MQSKGRKRLLAIPPGARNKRFRSNEESLHAERAAATAGALNVWIIELKAGALERLDVVDFDTIEIHRAHLVDSDLEAVKVHNFIGFVSLIFERHVVLETRAAATDNGDATDLVSFPSHDRKVFNGRCVAIIRAKAGQTGTIKLKASADHLKTAKVSIKAAP